MKQYNLKQVQEQKKTKMPKLNKYMVKKKKK